MYLRKCWEEDQLRTGVTLFVATVRRTTTPKNDRVVRPRSWEGHSIRELCRLAEEDRATAEAERQLKKTCPRGRKRGRGGCR